MAKHVLVAGSLHHDLVVHADRFPAADDTVAGHSPRHLPGGKGGNQAAACTRNGAPAALAARMGDDAAGALIAAHLAEAGVDIALLQTGTGEITGSSITIVNAFGEVGAIVLPGANLAFDPDAVVLPADTGYLLLQNELPEAANLALAEKAAGAGIPIVLNGCPFRETADALLSATDVLILGLREAEDMAGHPFSDRRAALEALPALAGRARRVVVFLGAGGMVHAERGRRPEYHPARDKPVESMHGALDFFAGAFVSQLAGGSEFEAAAHYAQAAATLFMTTPVERRDLIRATQIRALLGEDER